MGVNLTSVSFEKIKNRNPVRSDWRNVFNGEMAPRFEGGFIYSQ